jgi:hypothetical protein
MPPLFAFRRSSLRLLASFMLVLQLATGQTLGSVNADCCRSSERCCDEAGICSDRGARQNDHGSIRCGSADSDAGCCSKHLDSGATEVLPDCCCVLSSLPLGLPPATIGEILDRANEQLGLSVGPGSPIGVPALPPSLAVRVASVQPVVINSCVILCRWQI